MSVILLYPIIENDLLGYIDPSGRVVIKPQYYVESIEECPFFSEGMLPVRTRRKLWRFERISPYGYIDARGELVIDPSKMKFPIIQAGKFKHGCAKVLVSMSKGNFVGLINDAGRFLGEPKFSAIGEFSEGLAPAVCQGQGQYETWTGYIDRFGVEVIGFEFLDAGAFRNGLAPASVAGAYGEFGFGLTPHYGFIDHDGDWVVSPQYEAVHWFDEGVGPVCVDGKWGVIDLAEKWIVRPAYSDISGYSGGLAIAWKDGKVGMLDSRGMPLIEIEYDDISGFHDGLCSMMMGPYWGLMDRMGNMILQPDRFEQIGKYDEGLAPAQEGFLWGYLNPAGELAMACKFDSVTPFQHGLAAVSLNGQWGYINYSGEVEIEPAFSYAEPFQNGLARVFKGNKMGWINLLGDFVWGPREINLPYRVEASEK